MSWLDDLTPDQEKANQAAAVKFTDAPPAPGFLTNVGESAKGLPKGLIDATNMADAVFDRAGEAIEGAAGITPVPGTMGDREARRAAKPQVRDMYRREYAIDPTTVGTAGQILYEVNKIIPRTIAGSALAGPLGGALAAGAPEGYAATTDAMDQGIDDATATQLGTIRGVTTGVGAILPGSGVVKGAVLDLAATTGLNVGLGMVDRYASGEVLRAGGYEVQAAQYEVLDRTAMTVDAVLGAAFWGVGRATSAPMAPTKPQVQAALAANLDHHRRTTAGPGFPVDPASARASGDAIDQAIAAVLRGEKVNVGEAVAGASFLRRPTPELSPALRAEYDPPLAGRAAVIAAAVDRTIGLESGGRADAKNPNSTATGAGQFIESTWLDVLGRNRPELVAGKTRAEILALRTDPKLSREMTTRFTEENATALEAAGVPVDEGTLYMAHHFGAAGATKMLRADPGTLVSSLITKGELKANPHLKGKTVAQAMDDFERRAGREPRARMASPDEVAAAEFATKARAKGVPENAIADLTPLAPRDSVTGFVDGRADTVKSSAIERAKAHVLETGQEGHYVSADIFNLGGLNAAMGNDSVRANVHYKAIADILAEEIRVSGADTVPLRTGGDEFGVVVAGVDGPTLAAAMARAEARIDAYTQANGLADIVNPKIADAKGTGLHIGASRITPGESVDSIISRADAGIDLSKNAKKGGARVNRNATGTAGADAPGGQARGAAGGARASDGGVRQPNGLGDAGLERSAGDGLAGDRRPYQVQDGRQAGVSRPSLFDPDAPAPKLGASGLPESPAVDAALQAASLDPSLTVALDDGTVVSAADALAALAKEQGQAEIDAAGYLAAANCFLRS